MFDNFDTQLIVTAAIAVALALLLPLLVRRAAWFFKGGMTDVVLPPLPRLHSIACARERLHFLREYLGEEFEKEPEFRVVEVPPGTEQMAREYLDPAEALGQALRFRSYASSVPLLLMDRAIDLLEFTINRGGLPKTTTYSAHVEPISKKQAKEGVLPWLLVIGSDAGETVERLFRDHAKWIGMGVAIREPLRGEFNALCGVAGGSDGAIGGRATDIAGTVSRWITCDHVLSPACPSARSPRCTPSNGLAPDIALLESSPCFAAIQTRDRVWPITGAMLEALAEQGGEACFATNISRVGAIKFPAGGYPTKTRYWRTPCVVIEASGVRWSLLRLLRAGQQFSRPGDSGSWILVRGAPELWLGMVAAGDPINRISFVIQADIVAGYAARHLVGSTARSHQIQFETTG